MPDTQHRSKENNEDEFKKQARKNLEQEFEGKADEGQPQNEGQDENANNSENDPQQHVQQNATDQQKQELDEAVEQGDVDKTAKTLAETYNVNLENVPESEREGFKRLAKSWMHSQGKNTELRQEAQDYKQKFQQLDQLYQNDPNVRNALDQAFNGNSQDQQEPQGQPDSGSQESKLDDSDVDEQTLISEGYVDESELNGLDQVSREAKLARAEIQYQKDQEIANFRQELQQERQQVKQEAEQEKLEEINEKRINDSFDRLVQDHGVDMAELDDETYNRIVQRAKHIRDPDNYKLIDEDALIDAARKEGQIKQTEASEEQTSQDEEQLQDTGFNYNERKTENQTPQDIEAQLEQRAAEKFNNMAQPSKKERLEAMNN